MKTAVNFIICSLTLSFIILFFYLRFTRDKAMIELNSQTILEYYDYFLVLFLISLSLFIYITVSYIIKQLLQKNKPTTSNYILKLVFWYQKVNIFYKTYGIIFDYLGPIYTQHLVTLTKHFLELSEKKQLILILIFSVLPRCLILIVFVLEIYSHYLHYYFYSLLLLVIPLIFKFFMFILTDIGPRVLPELEKLLDRDYSNNTEYKMKTSEGPKRLKAVGLRFKPELANCDLDHFLYNYYYPVLFISGEMEVNFLPRYTKITLVVLLSYLGIHILGWGYLLFWGVYV